MATTRSDLGLTGFALTPGKQRSWWLRDALAQEKDPNAAPPLKSDAKADVVIVGGGFTGLWTAYHLHLRNPNLGIVVLEQDICGGGPSGRNGGFASGWWDELHGLVKLYGTEGAVKACRAIKSSIASIGEFCDANGIDAWFRHGGYMYAITAEANQRARDEMVELARRSETLETSATLAAARSWATGPPCSRLAWRAACAGSSSSRGSPSTKAPRRRGCKARPR